MTATARCLLIAVLAAALSASEPPNLLVVITDDLNVQTLRDASPVRVPTPNLDRLAERGVRFVNAHAVSPICGPSRAGFLCGYYPQTSGYWGWQQQRHPWRKNPLLGRCPTVIEHARDHGYHVAGGGKIFHNGHHDPEVFQNAGRRSFGPGDSHGPWPLEQPGPAWREWTSHPDFPGMGQFGFYTPLSNVPSVPPEDGKPGYAGWGDHGGPFRYAGPDDRDPMPDEHLARWAADWLSGYRGAEPFLLCVGFNRPHSPWVVPDEYFERFPLDRVATVATRADDVADTAPALRPPEPDTATRAGLGKHDKIIARDGDLREWTRAYMACVSFVDDQLGVVLDALEASDHAANTVVIVLSDHGYHMGEKQRVFKNTVWEPSTAVPLLIAGPGLAAGTRVTRPVSLIDLYPTVVELAGLPGERRGNDLPPLDGHSLVPLCRDPTAGWDGPDLALSTVPPRDEPPAGIAAAIPRMHWSVRSERYRYVRANDGGEELYDLAADPHEWDNRAGEAELATVQAGLRAGLERLVGSDFE